MVKINSENLFVFRLFPRILEKSKQKPDPLLSRDLAGYKGPGTPLDHRVLKSEYVQTGLEPKWIYINPL